jgi:hypothetical protein
MAFSLSAIFKHTQPISSDGLTQPQREAIVDLLHLCMYADNLISLDETAVLDKAVGSFAWEPQISFQSYEARSIAKAREAKENEAASTSLCESVKSRLNTPASRIAALKLAKQLLAADGTTDNEAGLLAKINLILG